MTIAHFRSLVFFALCIGLPAGEQQASVFTVRPVKYRFSKSEAVNLTLEIRNTSKRDVLISDPVRIPYEVMLELRNGKGERVPFSPVPSVGYVRKFQLLPAKGAVKSSSLIPTSCDTKLSAGGFCLSEPGKYIGFATYIGNWPALEANCKCITVLNRVQAPPFEFWVE